MFNWDAIGYRTSMIFEVCLKMGHAVYPKIWLFQAARFVQLILRGSRTSAEGKNDDKPSIINNHQ